MLRARDSELIFPIKDAASAALMLIKADCLHTAGIIDEAEQQLVQSRARMFLDDAIRKNLSLAQSCRCLVEEHSRTEWAGAGGFQNVVGNGIESS